jgi:hypothetical protein
MLIYCNPTWRPGLVIIGWILPFGRCQVGNALFANVVILWKRDFGCLET